jgi:signal transduction histidine kinase
MPVDIQTLWAAAAAAGGLATAFTLWRGRAEAREAAARAILAEAPEGALRRDASGWRANAAAVRLLGAPDAAALQRPAGLTAFLSDADRETVQAAFDELIARGQAFDLTARSAADARPLLIQGRRAGGAVTVWIRDDGAAVWLAERAEREAEERALLRGVLDTLPLPVWWRRAPDLAIEGHNNGYTALFGADTAGRNAAASDSVQTPGSRDLARLALRTGSSRSESRNLVTATGDRRAFDIVETPVPGHHGVVAGFGQDMTALEALQTSLAEHVAVQDEVLERLSSAIAVYGPDRRLKFFNQAYAQTWRLEPAVLEDQPSIGSFLQLLRDRSAMPEMADFPAYRRRMEALFTGLVEPMQELLHLPDGRTLRMVVQPHPLGGLIFQYEDVTDRLALESSHQMLTAVQVSTLNSLFEGVAVFGRDGRLKLFNRVYAAMFGLEPDWLAAGPHVGAVAERAKPFLVSEDKDWDRHRARLIAGVAEPRARQGRMSLTDRRVLQYAYVPLPDGQCLVLYFDITDSIQVEEALREKNRALENADLLKSQFISSVSYELRTPLNAIIGFGELLRLGLFDKLTPRQEIYVDDILSAATALSDLVGDILDLAAVQAGFMEFEHVPVDLGAALEEAAEAARRNAAPEAELTIEIPDIPITVRGDRRRTVQALRNLMLDALNAGAHAVPVRVSLSSGGRDRAGPGIVIQAPAPSPDEYGWAEAVLAGERSAVEAEKTFATGADIGISLARSLLHAQSAVLLPGPDPRTDLRIGFKRA